MTIFYALEPKTLEKYWAFRDAENRIKGELGSAKIAEIRDAMAARSESKEFYTTDKGVANVHIAGMLTPRPTLSAALFGETETVYTDIGEATLRADEDPMVSSIAYHIDSPGGYWDGCDLAAQIIAEAKKPTTAIIYAMAASGGYYLASQADKIVAASRGSMAGSIGVATEVFDRKDADKKNGVQRVIITNNASKDKRPDVTTEEGYQVIQDELDDLYSVFEERVIEGRSAAIDGFSAENVRALKGRTVTARRALKLGLIDEIQGLRVAARTEAQVLTIATQTRKNVLVEDDKNYLTEGSMNLHEFLEGNPEAKAEHDSLVAQKAKAEADQKTESRIARAMEILDISGVAISAATMTAIKEDKNPGDFAVEILKAQKGKAPVDNSASLGGVSAAPETKDDAPEGGPKYAEGKIGFDELYKERVEEKK